MNSAMLSELERQIHRLTPDEQLWLIEQMVHQLRKPHSPGTLELELAAVAADPDIQREIREIDEEFKGTESDGLEDAG